MKTFYLLLLFFENEVYCNKKEITVFCNRSFGWVVCGCRKMARPVDAATRFVSSSWRCCWVPSKCMYIFQTLNGLSIDEDMLSHTNEYNGWLWNDIPGTAGPMQNITSTLVWKRWTENRMESQDEFSCITAKYYSIKAKFLHELLYEKAIWPDI